MKPGFHELKTWPEFFNDVWSGDKTFELRKDDGFKVGDILKFKEWSRIGYGEYTGREITATVTFVMTRSLGMEAGWIIMSLSHFFLKPKDVDGWDED